MQSRSGRLALLLTLGTMASACGADRFIILGTPDAPSSSGYIEVEEGSNGIDAVVVLQHLHPPQSLGPRLTHYVVWVGASTGLPLRAGVLSYDPAARVGTLGVQSPTANFTVIVTAETSAEPAKPDGLLVAKQEIRYDD